MKEWISKGNDASEREKRTTHGSNPKVTWPLDDPVEFEVEFRLVELLALESVELESSEVVSVELELSWRILIGAPTTSEAATRAINEVETIVIKA